MFKANTMRIVLCTKSVWSLSFLFVLSVVFLLPFCAWKTNATGLSLTHCDDVCGMAKEPTFKDDDNGAHSKTIDY